MKRILIIGVILFITIGAFAGAPLNAQTTIGDKSPIAAPPSIALVGVEYTFQIPVDAGITATFKITRGPIGMTIDSVTGIVKWTPIMKGTYSTEVRITFSSLKTYSYAWTIQVVNFIGTIKGEVKNENNELLKKILISAYKKVNNTATTIYSTLLSAYTDSAGVYSIAVADSGEFYLLANPGPSMIMMPIYLNGNYLPVWYIDSPTMTGATAVPVTNATPVIANFILKKYQPPVAVSLSGTVSGADGKPIAGATVVASIISSSGTSSSPGVSSSYQDPGFGLFCNVGGKERSDSLGHYKLSVVSGNPYVVAAYKEGYILQYYNGKSNVLEADKITVKHDTSGINFKLSAVSVATAKISGVVLDSAKVGIVSHVIIYTLVSPQPSTLVPIPPARTTNTDSLGIFTFNAVANGTYKTQVVPISKYMPAYFKVNSCGVSEAKTADTIIVKNNQNVSGLIVCVKKIVANGGGKISGRVRNSDGSGLCGVVVVAESQNSCSYGITESDGAYEITSLDPGNYTVVTDKLGYTSIISTAPVIDYANGLFTSEANFTLTQQITTLVEPRSSDFPVDFALYRNYPNPFNPSTQISFSIPSDGYASLRVYNILGQEVATLLDGFITAGRHSVMFESTNILSSGVYMYELRYKDKVAVNKMILMK